ncbi:MAG: hypothetical protein ACOX3T_08205 [Bdellovibrionota bacterium]
MNKFSVVSALFVVSLCLLLGGCKEKSPNDTNKEAQQSVPTASAPEVKKPLFNEGDKGKTGDPELDRIIDAVVSNGYYFDIEAIPELHGREKPSKITSGSSAFRILDEKPEDLGVFCETSCAFQFDGEYRLSGVWTFVWANTNQIPLIEGLEEALLLPKFLHERMQRFSYRDRGGNPGDFINNHVEIPLEGGMTIENTWGGAGEAKESYPHKEVVRVFVIYNHKLRKIVGVFIAREGS